GLVQENVVAVDEARTAIGDVPIDVENVLPTTAMIEAVRRLPILNLIGTRWAVREQRGQATALPRQTMQLPIFHVSERISVATPHLTTQGIERPSGLCRGQLLWRWRHPLLVTVGRAGDAQLVVPVVLLVEPDRVAAGGGKVAVLVGHGQRAIVVV